ncbi:hypothetical protein PsorP6_000283 [Peronosclerospora sorghi]|uniref:Uncharacterized protein n=1 Tax=Peronosclerospora sorghi TaxID=230839 RepID=A0ACC0WV44_9STRA|nr:hypothetical protein PsorP6_000283 [Peronosclerospora sorghi]
MRAHYEGTGPEIWEQLEGQINGFVTSAGTSGTIAGISTFLKEQNANMKVWLIDPEETAAMAVFINNKRSTSMMEDGFEMVPMAKGSTIAEVVAELAWVNENLRKSIADQAVIDTRAGAIGGETAKTLEALRNHPQFDALRQLVQSNPASLPAVLQQIGAQSPELLRLINQNQDRFVQMLNEPIGTRGVVSASSTTGAAPFDLGMGGGGAVPTPQQIQQLVDSVTPEQQGQMAAQMGMFPEQLRGLYQMLSNLPPGAMEQMIASMSGGGLEILDAGARAGTGMPVTALCYLKKKQQKLIGCAS